MSPSIYARNDLQKLLDLQEVDAQIDRRRATIARAAADPEVAALQARSAEADRLEEVALEQATKLRRTASWEESEADSIRAKIREMERKMYGGEISSVKELDQMGAKVEQLREALSKHEEAGLAAIVELETVEPALAEAEKSSDQALAALRQAEARRDREVAELEAELKELEPRRERLAAGIPEQLLSRYDRIRKARGGVGAAALDRKTGLCGACKVKVPVALADSVRHGTVDTCESCGRLLVYVGEGAPE